jgi:SET domain-containing protein
MILTPPSVYVKDTSTEKGRGVFALRAFSAGDVVESCPVVVLRPLREALPAEFQDRVFHWEWRSDGNGTSALALGYGSLYNHNNPANMHYEVDLPTFVIRFIAVRDIKLDEELTINYSGEGGAAVSSNDWWFEEKKIKPVLE